MLASGARKSSKFVLKVRLSIKGKKFLKLMKSHSGIVRWFTVEAFELFFVGALALLFSLQHNVPAGIYLLKVNCEICSKLTIKTPERRHWHRSGVVIVHFEHISHLVLLFLLLTLNM